MKKFLKFIYKKTLKRYFPPNNEIIDGILIDELKNCTKVLDLGCGPNSPLGRLKNDLNKNLYSVGVDIFEPYIEKNKMHSECIQGNIFDINFPENSFDCALLLDVIEHFEKKDFIKFMPKLEKIAKKIIVMVPNGFINQDEYDKNIYQTHRSGWSLTEMEGLGFKCHGVSGLKFLRGELGISRIKPRIIGEILSTFTGPFIYNRPKIAFHLICIKNNYDK